MRHGGSKAVAEQLGRVHGVQASVQRLLQHPEELKEALLVVAEDCGLEDGLMPSQQQLMESQQHELLYVSIVYILSLGIVRMDGQCS